MNANEELRVIDKTSEEWYFAEKLDGSNERGVVPASFRAWSLLQRASQRSGKDHRLTWVLGLNLHSVLILTRFVISLL